MLLLVGLGNPGASYARHRHNVGFMVVERIALANRLGPWRTKFASLIADGLIGERKVLLQKPQTFMNRSGHAVAEAARYFHVDPPSIVVCHDEIDLAPGKVRIKLGGGVAGHNGLRSLAEQLGTRDFRRVRIGVGHPGHKDRVAGYVLHDFAKADQLWLEPLLDAVVAATPLIVAGDDPGAMNKIALLTRPAAEPKPGPEAPAGTG